MVSQELFPAFEKNNVAVVLSSNNLYVPYVGVFLQSLLDHASGNRNYDIIILERDISEENKRALNRFSKENILIRFCDPSVLLTSVDIGAMETKQYPIEVYYKILAPYMLKHYSKIVVSDADTLLKSDIGNLFDAELKGACLGAVQDVVWQGYYNSDYTFASHKVSARAYCNNVLTMKDPLAYVNSGVLVFDCEKYRDNLTMGTILDTARQATYICPDQDVLNLLMEGKIKMLDPAWNVFVPVNAQIKYAIKYAENHAKQAYDRAYTKPGLLHWAAKPKPWVCPDVDYGGEWWNVAMRTPFVGHIVARMFDELTVRKEHYRKKYGKEVAVWEPVPRVNRSMIEM